jgi:hypothetical protein
MSDDSCGRYDPNPDDMTLCFRQRLIRLLITVIPSGDSFGFCGVQICICYMSFF